MIDEIEPGRAKEDLGAVPERVRVEVLGAVEANDVVDLAVAADRAVDAGFLVAASDIEARGLIPEVPVDFREETEPEGDMTEARLCAMPGSAAVALLVIEEAREVRDVVDGMDFVPAVASEMRREGVVALVTEGRVTEGAGFDIVETVIDLFKGEVGIVPPGPEMLLDTAVADYV